MSAASCSCTDRACPKHVTPAQGPSPSEPTFLPAPAPAPFRAFGQAEDAQALVLDAAARAGPVLTADFTVGGVDERAGRRARGWFVTKMNVAVIADHPEHLFDAAFCSDHNIKYLYGGYEKTPTTDKWHGHFVVIFTSARTRKQVAKIFLGCNVQILAHFDKAKAYTIKAIKEGPFEVGVSPSQGKEGCGRASDG